MCAENSIIFFLVEPGRSEAETSAPFQFSNPLRCKLLRLGFCTCCGDQLFLDFDEPFVASLPMMTDISQCSLRLFEYRASEN